MQRWRASNELQLLSCSNLGVDAGKSWYWQASNELQLLSCSNTAKMNQTLAEFQALQMSYRFSAVVMGSNL